MGNKVKMNWSSERGDTMIATCLVIAFIALIAIPAVGYMGHNTLRPFCEVDVPVRSADQGDVYDQHLQYSGGSAWRPNDTRLIDGKKGDCKVAYGPNQLFHQSIWHPLTGNQQ